MGVSLLAFIGRAVGEKMAILLLTSFTLQDTVPIITAATEKRHLQFMIALWEHRVFMCFDFGAAAAFFLFHQKESCVWSVPIMGALGNLFKECSMEQARCSYSVPMGGLIMVVIGICVGEKLAKRLLWIKPKCQNISGICSKKLGKTPGGELSNGGGIATLLQSCLLRSGSSRRLQQGSGCRHWTCWWEKKATMIGFFVIYPADLGGAIVKTIGDERSKNGGSVKSPQKGCYQSGSSRWLQRGSHGCLRWPYR
jgi:hypothetical protein